MLIAFEVVTSLTQTQKMFVLKSSVSQTHTGLREVDEPTINFPYLVIVRGGFDHFLLKNCEVLQQSMVGSLQNKCSEACNAALILKLTSTVHLVHVLRGSTCSYNSCRFHTDVSCYWLQAEHFLVRRISLFVF